jgi:uncharacterized BrkB/YihY/UPF0761 family membrane protein
MSALWRLVPLREASRPELRSLRVTILLLATCLMCLADLALTLTFVTTTGMLEANPLARSVMEHNSPGLVVVWKLATMVLGLGILYWIRRNKWAEVGSWVCFAVMAALSIHWFTYTGVMASPESEYAAMAAADDPRFISITP